jgi:small subunit ribosomal protein S20
MANHKSAIKRHKQSLKKKARNKTTKTAVRTAIKKVRAALEAGDTSAAKDACLAAEILVAKAAAKGILHKKNASRRVGRLASAVAAASK